MTELIEEEVKKKLQKEQEALISKEIPPNKARQLAQRVCEFCMKKLRVTGSQTRMEFPMKVKDGWPVGLVEMVFGLPS